LNEEIEPQWKLWSGRWRFLKSGDRPSNRQLYVLAGSGRGVVFGGGTDSWSGVALSESFPYRAPESKTLVTSTTYDPTLLSFEEPIILY
jgi:hypothetical protein